MTLYILRTCVECGVRKPISEFPLADGGHRHKCFPCVKAAAKVTRVCDECGRQKPISEFLTESGHGRYCQPCRTARKQIPNPVGTAVIKPGRRVNVQYAPPLGATATCQACGGEMPFTSRARRYCEPCRIKIRDRHAHPARHYCSCGQPIERIGTCEACSAERIEYRVTVQDVEDVPLGAW